MSQLLLDCNQESIDSKVEYGVAMPCSSYARPTPKSVLYDSATHFVTINIPVTNCWNIKRYRMVFDRKKLVEDKVAYGDVGTDDQYKWLKFMLTKCKFDDILEQYNFWFELTRAENVHIHGLIKTRQKTDFKFKDRLHDVFNLPRKNYKKHFIYSAPYKKHLWNDYDIKEDRGNGIHDKCRTSTTYARFKNAEIRKRIDDFSQRLCGSADRKCLANDNERPAKERESNASLPVEGKTSTDVAVTTTQEQQRIDKLLTIIL